MTRLLSSQLQFACLCTAIFLAACGDAEQAKPKPEGTGKDSTLPPRQKAIYLHAKEARPAGTTFRNTATLTMNDASMITRRGEDTVTNDTKLMMREIWEYEQASPNERIFNIEDMSLSYEAIIGGKASKQRSESTLGGIPFKVIRGAESAPWTLVPGENKLSPLQETEMRMLGKLWTDSTQSVYPVESLDLGQTWKADPKAFGMIVSPRLKIDEGEVTCRLEEITVLRGERCGAINVDVDITGTIELGGSAGMKVQIALTGTIMRSLYKNYDMRTELKGSMQMEMDFPKKDMTISIDGVAEFLQLANMKPPQPE